MNIIILPEYSETGGTLAFLLKLLKINYKNSNKVSLLIEKEKNYNEIDELIKEYGFDLIFIPQRPLLFHKPYFSVLFEMWIWLFYIPKRRIDLFLVSNGTPWLNLGYIFFKKSMIYFMHTYPQKKLRWKSFGMYLLSKQISKKKCVVTVSEYAANQISIYMNISKNNIHVIYNSYDRKFENIIQNKTVLSVLTVGHVIDYKNPELWLKVARRVLEIDSNVKFCWVGDGPLLDYMREKVIDLGLSQNIIFYGNSKNVADFYSKSAIYFQPSKIESHGISVVEAMSVGLPCVVSKVGGMPESVIKNVNGFQCELDDISCYSNRIIELLNDLNLSRQFGKEGREIARKKFHESTQESKIMDLFNEIIK